MRKPLSASKTKRAARILLLTLACYGAYGLGTAVVITGHELAHFAGAGSMPAAIVLAPSEAAYASTVTAPSPPALVYYLDEFIPAVTGSSFFDPSIYSFQAPPRTVAAAWFDPVAADRESAVTLYPFYLAIFGSILAGLMAMKVRRLPVFVFGLAIGLGGFHTLHHLVQAGLADWQAKALAFLVLALYLAPAAVGFGGWCRKNLRRQPRTFRPIPRVRGYTIMPCKPALQFQRLGAPQGK